MSDAAKSRPRLIVVYNGLKAQPTDTLRAVRPWLAQRADIVVEVDSHRLETGIVDEMPDADFLVIFGGDGTIIAGARHLVSRDLPVVGINCGTLGFLTEFTIDDLKRYWDAIVTRQAPITRRIMLHARVFDEEAADVKIDRLDLEHCRFEAFGLNDAVIAAGPPFRMIELALCIDPDGRNSETRFSGDGVIVSTPTGSTAYNLSANGPILSPDVDAFCITPICPHSISFRPIVVSADRGLLLRVQRANEGTTLSIDGQMSTGLKAGEQVFLRRSDRTLAVVKNPEGDYWHNLAAKMHWASRPRNV